MKNLKKKKKNEKEILIVDLETTGFYAAHSAIVEISALKTDSNFKNYKVLLNTPILEQTRPINKNSWIFRETDLTYNEVLEAPKLESIRADLQKYLKKYRLCAYNLRFEYQFLISRDFKIYQTYPDPMLIATQILKIPHDYYHYKFPKLTEVADYFDIHFFYPHRAYNDCVATLIFLQKIKNGGGNFDNT